MESRLTAARQDPRPPFLLLRSFFERNTQSLFYLDNSVVAFLLQLWRFEEQPSVDFVSQLSQATTAYGPLLAIGGREIEQPGQSKHRHVVFVDSSELDWEYLFLEIAKASKAVLLLPGRTKGILKEVSLLVTSGLLGKTIVLMPGTGCLRETSQEALDILQDKWNHIRVRWMSKGFRLPSYVEEGMLYVPNIDFSIKHSCLLETGLRPLDVSFTSMLSKVDGTCSSTRDLFSLINR